MKLYFSYGKGVGTFLLYLVSSSLVLTGIQAANIDIQWAIQTYDDTTAQVGDTITFNWASGHSVYIHPSGTCQADGAVLVGDSPPATYSFTADDAGQDLFFVCGVDGHCAAGQTITVAVTAAATDATPTETPMAAPMDGEGNNGGGSGSMPSNGPNTMGGGSTTQAPTSASGATTVTRTTSTIIMMLLFMLTVSTTLALATAA